MKVLKSLWGIFVPGNRNEPPARRIQAAKNKVQCRSFLKNIGWTILAGFVISILYLAAPLTALVAIPFEIWADRKRPLKERHGILRSLVAAFARGFYGVPNSLYEEIGGTALYGYYNEYFEWPETQAAEPLPTEQTPVYAERAARGTASRRISLERAGRTGGEEYDQQEEYQDESASVSSAFDTPPVERPLPRSIGEAAGIGPPQGQSADSAHNARPHTSSTDLNTGSAAHSMVVNNLK